MWNKLFIAAGILFFFAISSVSFLVSSAAVVSAAEEKKDEAAAKEEPKADKKKTSPRDSLMSGNDKEPTVITAESLTTDNNSKTALFKGSVVAKKGDKTLYADTMLVYYTQSSDGESSNVDRIEAEGKVKLVRLDRMITSDKAVYYAGDNERAVFTGNPRATEGKNLMTGTTMTYYIKDDRSVVENSKVFMVERDQGTQTKKGKAPKADESKKK